MPNMLIIAKESKELVGLSSELIRNGFECSILPNGNVLTGQLATQAPDLILVELDGYPGTSELIHKIRLESSVPIIALVARNAKDNVDDDLPADDFLISPYDVRELVFRAKRLLNKTRSRNGEVIRCGDLLIDQVKCEVTLSGTVVMLTFKEYELLKFLAGNPGRVFIRETLLNSVWGYDYYGGDRTVDVHIRRLRGKIEDSSHTFIETVRNIGYRFKTEL
ncbi:response regulator transcription factor [Chloroflexota bacterium]